MVHATAKGGFLAPTRAWLLHMGEKIDYSPKVGRKKSTYLCIITDSILTMFCFRRERDDRRRLF